jgi:hypothetical protein
VGAHLRLATLEERCDRGDVPQVDLKWDRRSDLLRNGGGQSVDQIDFGIGLHFSSW